MLPNFWTLPTILYLLIMVVCLYGVGLFTWWWWKIGRATEVYIYVTGLLFGIGLTAGIGLRGRYLHSFTSQKIYDSFVTGWAWSVGPLLVLTLLCFIVGRMTRRVFRNYAYRHGMKEDRRHAKLGATKHKKKSKVSIKEDK